MKKIILWIVVVFGILVLAIISFFVFEIDKVTGMTSRSKLDSEGENVFQEIVKEVFDKSKNIILGMAGGVPERDDPKGLEADEKATYYIHAGSKLLASVEQEG